MKGKIIIFAVRYVRKGSMKNQKNISRKNSRR